MNLRKSKKDFDDVLTEQLKNPEFKKCFDKAGAEYATFKNAMEARKEAGLTQEDIAERTGTTQSSVARLEMKLSKGILPSHTSLVKYASALGKRVVITFV
ncbi:DNA-binding helix-turn-helix protein [Burkholderiales bacterium 1_1_47]|nr:DNA-binding helix-turn-helix protein [Burkholderiales bacterium 1_1_47]